MQDNMLLEWVRRRLVSVVDIFQSIITENLSQVLYSTSWNMTKLFLFLVHQIAKLNIMKQARNLNINHRWQESENDENVLSISCRQRDVNARSGLENAAKSCL